MTGFNLPPGVEVHHIPGNTPEDLEEDKFYATIERMLADSIGESRADHFFEYIGKGDFEEVLNEYVSIAAGLAGAKAIMEERMISERDPACVERWPECESGAYDPRCCRFPKSCSCTS